MLNKREKNKIYDAIVERKLDPAEFDLEDTDEKVVITHNSGSEFEFSPKTVNLAPVLVFGPIDNDDPFTSVEYEVKAIVAEGINETSTEPSIDYVITVNIPHWLREIQLTVGVPDYWEELKRSQESIAVIRREDFENTPFSEDEQRQISAQLQEIKNRLEHFQLPREQMSQVEERLDKIEEASHHLGRKDWLIMVITTISPVVVSDIMPPGLMRHVFILVINGLIHLFGGGPPQILA
jgi:hypothetical protein